MFFFFNDTATTEIYTLSLHDALPIFVPHLDAEGSHHRGRHVQVGTGDQLALDLEGHVAAGVGRGQQQRRSEEHTSELQSRQYLVCRLLLEKKKNNTIPTYTTFYLSPA